MEKIAYRRKTHCLACCSSPPLWHAYLSTDPTFWGSLISYPVYGHISTGPALVETSRHHARSELFVGHIFNPRHSSIVDVIHVPCIDVIDSYLHLNGFIRVEHKWSETNYFTVRVSQGRYMRHVTPVTLKWEPCKVVQKRKCKEKKKKNGRVRVIMMRFVSSSSLDKIIYFFKS